MSPATSVESASSEAFSLKDQAQQEQTTDLYRKALTYNVIGKYDPKIKHLITHTYHCTIFKYDSKIENWNKLDIEGILALYSRDTHIGDEPLPKSEILLKELYTFGLIILNRLNVENISIGLIGNSKILSEESTTQEIVKGLKLELTEGLIIIKSLSDETYGVWIHDEKVRDDFYQYLSSIVES